MNPLTSSLGGQEMVQDEAGASDNRLSLVATDERWASTVGNWEDGKKYTMSITVEQVSPGEFVVLKASGNLASGETDNEPEDETESEPESEPEEESGYSNPAVRRMMA